MQQFELFPLPNPCIGVCQVNAKGYCQGCFRTRDERFNWQKLSSDQQRNVIRLAHNRKVRYWREVRAQQRPKLGEDPSLQNDLPLDFPPSADNREY